jgi:hypothetical protein
MRDSFCIVRFPFGALLSVAMTAVAYFLLWSTLEQTWACAMHARSNVIFHFVRLNWVVCFHLQCAWHHLYCMVVCVSFQVHSRSAPLILQSTIFGWFRLHTAEVCFVSGYSKARIQRFNSTSYLCVCVNVHACRDVFPARVCCIFVWQMRWSLSKHAILRSSGKRHCAASHLRLKCQACMVCICGAQHNRLWDLIHR